MNTTFNQLLRGVVLYTFIVIFLTASAFGQQKSTAQPNGYGNASYTGIKPDEFLKNWLISGIIAIDQTGAAIDANNQKLAFDNDILTKVVINTKKAVENITIANKTFNWQSIRSETGTIDFVNSLEAKDFCYVYALAEVKAETTTKILFGVGSDDGIKIFLNGVLVHSNWTGRGLTPDEDIVALNLQKGSNQLLVKIQNMEGGWGFAIRPLGKPTLSNLLIESSGNGNLDNVKLLTENGVDVNSINSIGLSAYQNAMIRGREQVMDYLKGKGADINAALPPLEKLIDNIFTNVKTGSTPAVTVLASQNGKIIYEKAYGYADIEHKIAATPETKFRIGSITKQFTASAILKLQEEGKINVQDKLSKYIPDFPRGDEVTIEHLLTHTSGIFSFTNRPAFTQYVTLPVTPQALIDSIKTYPYNFNPGERYLYNNSGFFILGYLIEKISGKSYAAYLHDTFFEPLGMVNTGVYNNTVPLQNEAFGYTVENEKTVKALNWNMDWAGGAGALYSTVKDLYLWNEAVFNGKVLSEKSLQAAFTKATLNNKEKVNYGYGWSLDDIRGNKFISHGGGLHGFVSYLERQPESKVTISVLCNSTPAPSGINPGQNAQLIAEYILWKQLDKHKSLVADTSITAETLKAYVGRYNYGRGTIMIVKLEGNQLIAQLTGQPTFPIFPSSKTEFYWKVVEAKISFMKDENGVVTHAIHNQGGQNINVKKLTDEIPVKVNSTLFDKYIGKFDAGGGFAVVVTKENDKLLIQGPNLPKYELLPASEIEYFAMEINARFKFKIEDTGIVNSVIITLDGQEIPAQRVK